MKYTHNRKYRDYILEEEVSFKKKRPIIFNMKKNIFQKILNFFKK